MEQKHEDGSVGDGVAAGGSESAAEEKDFADSFRDKFQETIGGLHEAFNTEAAVLDVGEPDDEGAEKAPEPVRVFGMTEEEFKAKLAKADEFDRLRKELEDIKKDYTDNRLRVYGQVGTLKTELEGIRKRVPRADAKARVAEHFQELVPLMWDDEDGAKPEPSAASQDKGVSVPVTQPPAVDIDREVDARLAKRALEQDVKALLSVHPDIVEIHKSEDWKKWMAEGKHEDPTELGKAITLVNQFKQYRDLQGKAEEQKEKRRERISRSVVSAGDGNVQRGGNDADEFKSSFKKSFARNMRRGFGG